MPTPARPDAGGRRGLTRGPRHPSQGHIQPRPYDPERDFSRLREFLVRTYLSFGTPAFNWGIERWNYVRFFVAPMLGSAGTEAGVPPGALRAIRTWEEMIRLWEDENGNIVGVANIEHPDSDHPWLKTFGPHPPST